MNIDDISLKSCMILEALVREKNVGRVATQLNLSQPAVSNALAKMRKILGDPLLIRTQQGMIPTARALEISIVVKNSLDALSSVIENSKKFDPKTSNRTFKLAMTDYMEWSVLPKLCELLPKVAPGIKLEVVPLKEEVPFSELEAGKIDLALGHFNQPAKQCYIQALYDEDFVCVLKKGSKLKSKEIPIKAYSECKHVIVSPWGGLIGVADKILNERGYKRNVVVSTSHFLMGPIIARAAGYCAILPRRLAEHYAHQYELDVFELPFEIPIFKFQQLWHARTLEDSSQKWLRNLIKGLFA